MERENYTGKHVSRTARLEPATPPGEVYASEAFAALAAVERVTEFTCEHVHQPTWTTHYSTFPAYVVQPCAQQRPQGQRVKIGDE
jgi:class 3 adenylate cyclase